MYSQRIRSLMGSMEPPTIHQSHARFGGTTTSTVSSRQTKATSSTDGSNHQAAISRRLPGRQSLSNVAVTGTALKTRTRPALTKYPVWICYRVATHQLNLYFPGRERDSTYTRHLALRKDFFIPFGIALGRPRCGHTSSRNGHERRCHPLK